MGAVWRGVRCAVCGVRCAVRSRARVPQKLARDALNGAAGEEVVVVGGVVPEPARLGLVAVVAADVVDKGRGLGLVAVAAALQRRLELVAADRLPVVRRLHELRKVGVGAARDLARALDDGGGVRVEDARVELDKPRRVAARAPLAVGELLGAGRAARARVPAAIGEAVGGHVAAVAVDVLLREEATDARRQEPDQADLGPLRATWGVGRRRGVKERDWGGRRCAPCT